MHIALLLPLLLIVSNAFVYLLEKVKIPKVVGFIVIGLLLREPLYNFGLLPEVDEYIIFGLGDFALIILMFLAGLGTSLKEFKHERKDAVIISFIGALLSFAIGFFVFWYLQYPLITALIVGIGMSMTADATTAALLLELKKNKSRVGTLIVEAGLIDNILGLSLFILITFLFQNAHARENILLSGAIIAFFIGIYVQHAVNHSESKLHIKRWLTYLIVPFFFISMGLNFDLRSIAVQPSIFVIMLVIAFFGKIIGALASGSLTDFSWKQLHLIGWAMNSRGAIELALALIAFRSGLIPTEIFSGLVLMALTTTLVFPFVITSMIRKNKKIMD
jgi:Kef-type K+ transport system membrane component KefB